MTVEAVLFAYLAEVLVRAVHNCLHFIALFRPPLPAVEVLRAAVLVAWSFALRWSRKSGTPFAFPSQML